jgi:hypothetical protein
MYKYAADYSIFFPTANFYVYIFFTNIKTSMYFLLDVNLVASILLN